MISRDFSAAARRDFDLVIVGGGIYGASLLQEAARRGLSACLCEAADFGGETSWNSLRIVHGGLRYLQTMDLRRFLQSVAARRRVARQFPSLVKVLRCLMPLYGQGLKRASVMRMALLANDLLSAHRNAGLVGSARLPGGGILDAQAVRREFPQVRTDGLEGAAFWSDYFMVSSERILMELLHDACRHGAVALNYARVVEILGGDTGVQGVLVRNTLTGDAHTITGRAVVNCAGPRVRDLARGRGGDAERLFSPSLAFNLLLDKRLEVDCALAVAPPRANAPILFLVPKSGALLAGTMHLPRPAETTEAAPTDAEIVSFLELLNEAIPGLDVRLGNVRRVFSGLLPAAAPGSADLLKREILEDHGRVGGPKGLYSVSGVKFTTANDVAQQLLDMIGADTDPANEVAELPLSPATAMLTDAGLLSAGNRDSVDQALQRVVADEAVQCTEDFVLRRTNWATTELDLEGVLERLAGRLSCTEAMPRRAMCE